MTPTEASKPEKREKVFKMEPIGEKDIKKIDLKEGDRVRIARMKKEGAKGYLPNWSDEIFIINKVEKTNPITFILKDAKGHIIKGAFYKQQLQKTECEITEDMGYKEPRIKANGMIGKEEVAKEALRQKEKKQRAAVKKKAQTGSGVIDLPDRVLSNVDLTEACKHLPRWRGVFFEGSASSIT